jgi:hypothetical protein
MLVPRLQGKPTIGFRHRGGGPLDRGQASPPSISGLARIGEVLTASFPDNDPNGPARDIAYQWTRNGINIPGATASTYTCQFIDLGWPLKVIVNYHDGQGFGSSLQSAATVAIDRVFPFRDENGTKALVDLDFERGLFYYNGNEYASFAAVVTAVGAGADNGDGTYTLGPAANLPFTNYNNAEGTNVCEYIKTGTTQSTFLYTFQQSGVNTDMIRALSLDASNRRSFDVVRTNVTQLQVVSGVGAALQQNYRFRSVDVYKVNDGMTYMDGELVGSPDVSGNVSAAVTNVSLMIGHRAGANKQDGTIYRFAYFPRAVSQLRRQQLSLRRAGAIVAGVWTWYNDPRVIKLGSDLVAGGVGNYTAGTPSVGKIDGISYTAHVGLEKDDHDNPGLEDLGSNNCIMQYSRHGIDNNYYQRLGTISAGVITWGSETNIATQLGATSYTYANLAKITAGLFSFHRAVVGANPITMCFSKSADAGVTWAASQRVLNGLRPYNKFCKNGANRIDFICNDGHPDEVVGNSTYHFYYDGATDKWCKSDGTDMGALPLTPATALTKIYDGASVESWVHQVAAGGDGKPSAVFAIFPNRVNDHRYYHAKWDGSAWAYHEICTAGGTIYPNVSGVDGASGPTNQDYYSGGICLDPDDVNTIYCSRPTKTDGTIGIGGVPGATRGIFQLWKGVTADNGATWTMTRLTNMPEDCFRPFKPNGATELTFCMGPYKSYIDFQGVTICKIPV